LLEQDDADAVLDALRGMRNWSPDVGVLLSSTNSWLSVVAEAATLSEAIAVPATKLAFLRTPLKAFKTLKRRRQGSRA